jgi:hypothetical protein
MRDRGFPLIVRPAIESAEDSLIGEDDIVIGIVINGKARAYPVNYMNKTPDHIVNDDLSGLPIALTWCPLAQAGAVYERRIGNQTFDFGVLGVDKGVLIMYDAQTNSQWIQLSGEATVGSMRKRRLEKLASLLTTWSEWKKLHPSTTVYLNRSTNYRPLFTKEVFTAFIKSRNGPVNNYDLIVGVEGQIRTKAYLLRELVNKRILNDMLEDAPILVYLHSDLTSVRIFDRTVEDRTLTFDLYTDSALRDRETGTIWNPLTGAAEEGPLKGEELSEHVSTYSLWYAWKWYRPDTILVDGTERGSQAGR